MPGTPARATSAGPGLVPLLVGDGRPLLAATGLALLLSGGFALFLSARNEFLPHDVAYLGMTPESLCRVHECRVVHFMIHDRVAFGGALCAIGIVYLFLTAGPLAGGERWAWWVLAASGAVGFSSFLAYLGYGYLDTWHGTATLALLPTYLAGLWLTRPPGWGCERPAAVFGSPGRVCLSAAACGMVGGGLTILAVGMTCVFVPEDVRYLGVGRTELDAINPRLVSLIAHDRAGFGGAVCCCGVLLAGLASFGEMTRALRQTLTAAGAVGFGTAVFIHPVIGYDDWWHLTPAVAGATLYGIGLVLSGLDQAQRRQSGFRRSRNA